MPSSEWQSKHALVRICLTSGFDEIAVRDRELRDVVFGVGDEVWAAGRLRELLEQPTPIPSVIAIAPAISPREIPRLDAFQIRA